MKMLPCRLACYLPALTGAFLVAVLTLSISASAGASSPTEAGALSLSAARADSSASLSNLARWKSGKLTPRLQRLS